MSRFYVLDAEEPRTSTPGGVKPDIVTEQRHALRLIVSVTILRKSVTVEFPHEMISRTAVVVDLSARRARLAAGDFDWLLTGLREASEERRAAVEERLLPWIVDPAAIARSPTLDPADPLAGEARIVAELFETVTSGLASPEQLAALGDVRRLPTSLHSCVSPQPPSTVAPPPPRR